MDRQIELEVISIAPSGNHPGAYEVLLAELNGKRKFSLVMGAAETQATVLSLKGIEPPRPLTHDLFLNALHCLEASLVRVLIYKVENGVFYSTVFLETAVQTICLDSRTSDAIALAVRADCPICVYESVLERVSQGFVPSPYHESVRPRHAQTSSLEEELRRAVSDENYELAAKLRDRINARNHSQ